MKLSCNTMKSWYIKLGLVVLLAALFYFALTFLQSYSGLIQILAPIKKTCSHRPMSKTWESLKLNIPRRPKLFLAPGDFHWQQQQSTLSLPFGLRGAEPFLTKILAYTSNYDMPASIEKLDCKTCIVVGNSFSNKNSLLGTSIDKYDVIIRMNDAPVRGYEDDVGSRTTVRLFYPESASANPSIHNDPDTLLALVPFKPNDLRWLKESLYNETRVSLLLQNQEKFWKPPPMIWLARPSQVRILDPYFTQHAVSSLLRQRNNPRRLSPTMGCLAVFVALNYCDVVHIVGFGYPRVRKFEVPMHYYGEKTMEVMKDSSHDVSLEAQVLKSLEEAGAIKNLLSNL